MATEFRSTTCFLCDAAARWKTAESGNCKYFICSSESCGDFVISRVAMRRTEGKSDRKKKLSEQAMRARIAGKVLRIVVDGPSKIATSLVSRDSAR